MLDKPIADITADDIQHLVDEGTPEKRTLEFKAELPGTNPAPHDFFGQPSARRRMSYVQGKTARG